MLLLLTVNEFSKLSKKMMKTFESKISCKRFYSKGRNRLHWNFSQVVEYTIIRIVLALVAHYNWELKQMDVKTAFLHGGLNGQIYMYLPSGFIDKKNTDFVYLLKKALYGLKQSPRQWNKQFDLLMHSFKFQGSTYDHCLYFKYNNHVPIFLVFYVDDMLISNPSINLIKNLQYNLCKNFKMKYLGHAK